MNEKKRNTGIGIVFVFSAVIVLYVLSVSPLLARVWLADSIDKFVGAFDTDVAFALFWLVILVSLFALAAHKWQEWDVPEEEAEGEPMTH